MGGLALLARELGHEVTGSDANVYPPMSTQLEDAGIQLMEGYSADNLARRPDLVVIGNALSRGNPEVEAVLDQGLPYVSGPQWLGEHVLPRRWVLAVSGTHGKTSTASMLAWLLEEAGLAPGFLIGGVPHNFGLSARLGGTDFFVIEADEYDTAFFDKRSKFIHYRPRTLVIGNLEFDHVDIFPDLGAIETQFHHLVRCVPQSGLIIRPASDAIDRVMERGCWTPQQQLGLTPTDDWQILLHREDGTEFAVRDPHGNTTEFHWSQLGRHNLANACGAIAAAHHVGVAVPDCVDAMESFQGVKRRLELRGIPGGVSVYDDFAHHPTAIENTLAAVRQHQPGKELVAVIEPRSNTMRSGVHAGELIAATESADQIFWYQPPEMNWSLADLVEGSARPTAVYSAIDELVAATADAVGPGDTVVIMSNGGFNQFHERLIAFLEDR
jgi:UDP-N-acetylmuramate: L-alanyl-gamma-D-glutamyl-meso-diaminopimelate ligase